MIFPYLSITSQIKRPIIPVMLRSGSRFIVYQTLIDSGADYCIFSIELALLLGVKLPKEKIVLRGIGGSIIKGRFGRLLLRVGDVDIKVGAIFADIARTGHGILGQKGFFEHFVVKFDYSKEEIELKPRETS